MRAGAPWGAHGGSARSGRYETEYLQLICQHSVFFALVSRVHHTAGQRAQDALEVRGRLGKVLLGGVLILNRKEYEGCSTWSGGTHAFLCKREKTFRQRLGILFLRAGASCGAHGGSARSGRCETEYLLSIIC